VLLVLGASIFFGIVLPSCLKAVGSLGGAEEEGSPDASVEEQLAPAASRPSPSDPLDRKVLRQDDFEWLGAFALPRKACGFSTAFGETGIALRRVNGKLHLLTASHRYSGDAIYEVEVPGYSKTEKKWPMARQVREWGDIYQDKKKIRGGKEVGLTHGLSYDETRGRLYFSFGSWYNIPPFNEPSLGYAILEEGGAKAFGSWKAPKAAHCQKIRGGSLQIPQWFAERFTGGRTLGLGFGGAYSGYSECSAGPFLAAVHPPEKEGAELDALLLIDHPLARPAHRNPDYRTEFGGQPNPRDGVGFWGWHDEILGAGTWIDLPDKHGVLFVTTVGHGRTWYEKSDIHADHVEASWFVYDPRDLAAVAQGRARPWDPEAAFWKVDYKPRPLATQPAARWRTPGCTFDAATRTLFVLVPFSYQGGVEWYSLIQAWRVR
jgi:hypothetical protein